MPCCHTDSMHLGSSQDVLLSINHPSTGVLTKYLSRNCNYEFLSNTYKEHGERLCNQFLVGQWLASAANLHLLLSESVHHIDHQDESPSLPPRMDYLEPRQRVCLTANMALHTGWEKFCRPRFGVSADRLRRRYSFGFRIGSYNSRKTKHEATICFATTPGLFSFATTSLCPCYFQFHLVPKKSLVWFFAIAVSVFHITEIIGPYNYTVIFLCLNEITELLAWL